MYKGELLNIGTLHTSVLNEFMRHGIPWGGRVRINHEGRELSFNLTNYVTEGTHKDCTTWTYDALDYKAAKRLYAEALEWFFDEVVDADKLEFHHIDPSKEVFLEVRVSHIPPNKI